MEKNEIIGHIHTLVSNNVIGDKQAMSRYRGFRGELFLESYMKRKYPSRKYFEGGMIISKDSTETSLDNAMYICVIEKNEYSPDYIKIFTYLSGIGFEKMILILYEDDKFEMRPVMNFTGGLIHLPVPDITAYYFSALDKKFTHKTKNLTDILTFFEAYKNRRTNASKITKNTFSWLYENLKNFSESQLLKIYLNRLFLDGFIGLAMKKGKASDIDMIIKNSEGKFSLIEIKEKDLPKNYKKGFGLDIPRLNDMIRISKQIGLDYFLIVREINNQTDRELIGYKYISIEDFEKDVRESHAVTGGTGMRSESTINETLICNYDLFRDL